jgi:hypothetical protein
VNVFHEQALKFLTPDADLTEMLRTMYRTGVDYCVILPFWNSRDYVIFTKDQLVLLIERGIPDVRVADIPKLAAEGIFKPLLFSDRPAAPDDADLNPDELQVLVIDDEDVGLSSLREALQSREPDFPAWWEAPVPLVMHRRRRTYANAAAERTFGEELKGLPRDLPEKDEFLLSLQSGETPRSLMFHRLEDDIFTLEDCTGDVLAAADIAWWAAVGKAWIAILDKGKRVYRRYEKAEIESMEEDELAVLSAENTLIPCEWESGLLGYLCVRKRVVKKERFEPTASEKAKTEKAKTGRTEARKPGRPVRKRAETDRPAEEKASGEAPEKPSREENEILEVLGPQAMGLLAAGTVFSAAEGAAFTESAEKDRAPEEEQPRPSPPSSRGKRRARKGAEG